MQRHIFCKSVRIAQALRPVASTAVALRRAFSMSRSSTSQLNSLHTFTDEEEMLRESGTLFLTRSGLTCASWNDSVTKTLGHTVEPTSFFSQTVCHRCSWAQSTRDG